MNRTTGANKRRGPAGDPPAGPGPAADPRDLFARWAAGIPARCRAPEPGSVAARIHAAARRRFAETGYEATTTRAVALDAGVNLAMIHYYFGSKDQLYQRVLSAEIVEFFAGIAAGLARTPIDPVDAVVGIPSRIVESLKEEPIRLQLLRREFGEGAPRLPAVIHELGPWGPRGFRAAMLEVVEGAQEAGVIVDFDAKVILLLLVSHAYGLLFMEPVIRTVFGGPVPGKRFLSELLDAERVLLRRTLEPDAAKGRPGRRPR